MSTALVERPTAAVPVVTDEQMDLIKRTVAKDATDQELKLFLYDCARRNVHPLDKLLIFTKRSGRYTPITTIDYFRSQAEATGAHAGTDDATFSGTPKGGDWASHVTAYRLVQGVRVPFTATARWAEYCPDAGASGEGDRMWRRMPHTMLAKCAEALALRKAFPKQLSGLYVREEMDQAEHTAPDPRRTQVVRTVSDVKALDAAPVTTEPLPTTDVANTATGELHEALPPDVYLVQGVTVNKTGTKNGRPWTLFDVRVHTGDLFSTFDANVADSAEKAAQDQRPVEILIEKKTLKNGNTERQIVSLSTEWKKARGEAVIDTDLLPPPVHPSDSDIPF